MHIEQPCESVLSTIMGQLYSLQLILKGEELRNLPSGALDKQQVNVLWAAWRGCNSGQVLHSTQLTQGQRGELNFR